MEENKKYRLTDETIEVNGRTLYRIEALKDFEDVKAGDKGGFVEREKKIFRFPATLGFPATLRFLNLKTILYLRIGGLQADGLRGRKVAINGV